MVYEREVLRSVCNILSLSMHWMLPPPPTPIELEKEKLQLVYFPYEVISDQIGGRNFICIMGTLECSQKGDSIEALKNCIM